jgi:hypothetical protein
MSSAHEPIQLLEPSNLLEPLDLTERQVVSFACFPRKSRSIGLSETPASPALNGKATGKRLRGPLVRAPCYPWNPASDRCDPSVRSLSSTNQHDGQQVESTHQRPPYGLTDGPALRSHASATKSRRQGQREAGTDRVALRKPTRPRRWRRESDQEIARRLRELGCSEAQVQHHLARKVPITLPILRPSIYAGRAPRYR